MIAVWIVLAVVYFVLAVATAVARRRWIIENGFLMSDDARPFFAGLFWPITLLVVIAYDLADAVFDE